MRRHILITTALLISTIIFINCASNASQTIIRQVESDARHQKELKFQKLIKEIIHRESSGRHKGVYGDNYNSYGICQFQWDTFHKFAKKYKIKNANYYGKADQISLMARMIKDGFGFEWSVYKDAYRSVYGTDPPPRGVKLV